MNSNTIYNKEITNPQDDKKKFYVYVYIDPDTREPFYVGKGSGDRMYHHLLEHKWNLPNNRKRSKIKSIMRKGKLPIISVAYNNLTESEAFQKEQSLIAHYGRRDLNTGCLTNMSDGGEGNTGHRYCSDENVYTLYHVSGRVEKMTRLEFREDVCNGNHQTCAAFFSGKNKACHGYSFSKEELDKSWIDPNKKYKFFDKNKNNAVYISINCGVIPAKMFKNIVKGRSVSYHGFCLYEDKDRMKTTGDRHYFTNIYTNETIYATQREFKDISGSANVYNLVNGVSTVIAGWVYGKYVSNETQIKFNEKAKYALVNKKTGELITVTIKEFKKLYGGGSKIFSVVRGKSSYKGWVLKKKKE